MTAFFTKKMSAAGLVNPSKLSNANNLFEELFMVVDKNMVIMYMDTFPRTINTFLNNLNMVSVNNVNHEDRGKTYFLNRDGDFAVFYPFQNGATVEVAAFLDITARWMRVVPCLRRLGRDIDNEELIEFVQEWKKQLNRLTVF